jgi:erythromycin esterase
MVRRNRGLLPEAKESAELISAVRALAQPLRGPDDLDPLLKRIGDAHYVLLGEASHGTSEYYTWRAALSRRLVEEKGFSFIAVEGDWPDCYRVNRYVKGLLDSGDSARDVLHAFERWPTWMWANEEIIELAEWLRGYNDGMPAAKKVGFYGLDVYSLWESLYAVMTYLHRVDPAALPAAWSAFRCFEPYGEDVREYARATHYLSNSCEREVIALLRQLHTRAPRHEADGQEAYFVAEQNALVVHNAEAYYRTMVRGGPDSWNIRDRHMADTLNRLMRHHGAGARGVVWEHNTHIGDARYTDMATYGMVNIGQLAREAHAADDVVLVGFGSHRGSVIAAAEWDAPMDRLPVPQGRPGSWESVLHSAGPADKLLVFRSEDRRGLMAETRGHRAIGVVYHPDHDPYGNYVPTVLPARYDAFVYIDATHALRPLHYPVREDAEVPETYPSGL